MENPNKIKKEAHKGYTELEHYPLHAKERIVRLLRGLPKDEMIMRINQLELSERSLDYLCFDIALQNEDYEICAAIINIKSRFSMN